MAPPRTSLNARKIASSLRKNQTKAEELLWMRLQKHQLCGVHFRRQHPVGNYIVDFCAPRKKLIIEIDGDPHIHQIEQDQERAAFLVSRGFTILRFWDRDVTDHMDETLAAIEKAIR